MSARGHLSAETLDLLSLSALAQPEGDEARVHLDGCGLCKKRWDELEEDRQRFTQFVLPRTLAAVEAKAGRRSMWGSMRQRWLMFLPALGLAAAALMVMVALPETEEPAYLLKGGARLDVVAQKAGGQLPVSEETVLGEGDRIRFLVEPAGASWVMVVSKDGAGDVTVYFPWGGEQSARIGEGFAELPGSIELDAVSGRESLFAVFSDEPVSVDAVRSALQQGRELSSLPHVVEVVEKSFLKDGR